MNKVRDLSIVLLLAISILSAIGCSGRLQPETPTPVPKVVARVNGVELTQADLEAEIRHTVAYYKAASDVDLNAPENASLLQQARNDALERIINQELIRQIAAGTFPPTPAGQTPTVVTVSDSEVQAQAQQYEEQAGGQDEVLRQGGFDTYDEFLDYVRGSLVLAKLTMLYGQAEQVHARAILVATEEEAQEVLARLQAGEDFATVAQEVSIDATLAAHGGDLGWLGHGLQVPEFEEAAFALEKGQISQPVKTQYGFYIIQVLDKGLQPDQQALQAWLEGLKTQAQIERLGP